MNTNQDQITFKKDHEYTVIQLKLRNETVDTIKDIALDKNLVISDVAQSFLEYSIVQFQAMEEENQRIQNKEKEEPKKERRIPADDHPWRGYGLITNDKRWARGFDQCLLCKSTVNKHASRGYCIKCYHKRDRVKDGQNPDPNYEKYCQNADCPKGKWRIFRKSRMVERDGLWFCDEACADHIDTKKFLVSY